MQKNKDPLSTTEDLPILESVTNYIAEKRDLGLLSPSSAYNRQTELRRFAKFCNSHKINTVAEIHKNLIVEYLRSLKISKNSKNTVKNILTAWMDYLVESSLVLENFAGLVKLPKSRPPVFDFLSEDEIDKLFRTEAEQGSKTTIDRNLLIFSLLLNLCLRVSEVSNLRVNDLVLNNGDDNRLFVTRKGGKKKELPVNSDLKELFVTWLAVRENYKNADGTPFLFLSTRGNQLDRKQIYSVVQAALRRAGILKRKSGPHLLRHTGASFLANKKVNPVIIQDLLDHESLSSTQKYLHFSKENLVNAVNQISVPTKGDRLKN